MALAETARLLAQYDFKDNSKAGIASATRGVGTLQGKVGGLQSSIGKFASNLKGGLSNALSTFGGRLRAFGIGIGAALGITGLFSFAGALKGAIGKASEFAFAIEKMQGLTNDSADSLARLIAVTDNYGISADRLTKIIGFTQKTLGNLNANTKAAQKFEDQFRFSIHGAHGQLLTFNQVLLKAADYYNSNHSQAAKAALAAKLFGKSYSDLVPILKLGSKGIKDAEVAAAQLGITLTKSNVKDLAKYREATRTLGDAVTGLELQIGLGLVPALTDLAKAATGFIASHRTDIVAFFKGAVQFGRDAIGTIGGVAEELSSAWDKVPKPLRDFIGGPLLKLALGEKVIKFLFGVSPLEIAVKGIEKIGGGLIEGLAGGLAKAGIGKAFVQPVFVVNMPPGGIGGAIPGGGVAGAAKTGISALGKVFLVGEAIGLVLAVNEVRDNIAAGLTKQSSDLNGAITNQINDSKTTRAQLLQSLAGVDQGIEALSHDPIGNALLGDQLGELQKMRKELLDALTTKVPKVSEKHEHHLAAIADQHERRLLKSQPGRDAASLAAAAEKQRKLLASLDSRTEDVKTNSEHLKTALSTKVDATTSKVGDLNRTTATGSSQIVSAIQRNRPIVNVSVSVVDTKVTVTQNYQSGSNVGQSGPKGSGE